MKRTCQCRWRGRARGDSGYGRKGDAAARRILETVAAPTSHYIAQKPIMRKMLMLLRYAGKREKTRHDGTIRGTGGLGGHSRKPAAAGAGPSEQADFGAQAVFEAERRFVDHLDVVCDETLLRLEHRA